MEDNQVHEHINNLYAMFRETDSEVDMNTHIFNEIKAGRLPLEVFIEYQQITQGEVVNCLKTAIEDRMTAEEWLKSHNIQEINDLLDSLSDMEDLDERMGCIDEILSELSTHDIDYSNKEDEIKDLAID